jgi:hydroxyacylglutathione hydrolase
MSSNKTSNSNVTVTAIKAFSDNYIWALTSAKANSNKSVLVDPGDAGVCIDFLEKSQTTLSAILITHHHPDHTGGIKELLDYCHQKHWPLTVYGPANEKIPFCDIKLVQSDVVNIDDIGISLTVIDLPGHTAGHIAYFANNDKEPLLFCGDTLFSGGCGRLFEGTAEQMLNSLTKLSNLPESTKVYCAHEYTQANLKFALTVEPNNVDLINYCKEVSELRANEQATIPTSIKVEKLINPFLRSHEQSIQASAAEFNTSTQTSTLDTFTTIRRWKDQF